MAGARRSSSSAGGDAAECLGTGGLQAMKLRPTLAARLPGVTWHTDLLRRVHVQFSESAMAFEATFESVQHDWTARKLTLSPEADVALAAIFAEAIIDPEQLQPFLQSLP